MGALLQLFTTGIYPKESCSCAALPFCQWWSPCSAPVRRRNSLRKQVYDHAIAAQAQAAADVASSDAAVRTARINLGYTDVVSPISGRIGPSQVTQGAYVQASAATPMATVQQIDPIYVDLNQSSVEGLKLRRDVANGRLKLNGPDQAKVTLILEDGTAYPESG